MFGIVVAYHLRLQEAAKAIRVGAPEALQVIGPMPTPFSALYEAADPLMPKGRRYAVDTLWSDARCGEILGRIVQDMERAPSETSVALVVLRSNAIETPPDAAFSCHGRVFGALYATWEDEGDASAPTWARPIWSGPTARFGR